MIDSLKEARNVMKDTEKYLSGIISYEWMQHHPHFHRNEKEHISSVVTNLISTYNSLSRIIDNLIELQKGKKDDNI